MFWIICLLVFLAMCTALTLIVRSRGGGDGSGTGVDNNNALQRGSAEAYIRRQDGPGAGPGGYGGPSS
ncbi:hypothetical protein GCM10011492_41640 [Flexivirga endophytica]|uniref:Uncharacterized protein n=1 Tax=Flexivirga endophytica TaxID=1849103 RepID=A0A916TKU1_9MICO|nr:hypothetical protein [Flexivirga endophytica]GGB46122.1 hypothetical protein GCM10011492_41640 [Flexivirga endophytica]GHB69884.1 hypothetical protein GCM10008112_42980 [Flexivirga endophytica]